MWDRHEHGPPQSGHEERSENAARYHQRYDQEQDKYRSRPRTHIARGVDYFIGNYRVITSPASKKETTGVVRGGTAPIIHESAQQYIAHITRQSVRVVRVTLDRKNSRMPNHIISEYAPRNGRTEEDRRRRWKDVNEILQNTCKRHMIMWRADANGQLGSEEEVEEQNTNQDNDTTKITGP